MNVHCDEAGSICDEVEDAATRLGWAPQGSLFTRVTVKFDFMDRLRILFGKKVEVYVHEKTEFEPGKALSSASVEVDRVFARTVHALRRLFRNGRTEGPMEMSPRDS